MEYRTIEGVELATVGEEWPTSAGEGTFTFQNLADAMEAANNDPHIRVPRGKLGHLSEINGELRAVSPFKAIGDAEPAFGLYTNLRLTNDGAALVGDWIEIPAWLADAAPSAYPSRSIEASLEVEVARDVTTEGGKRYSMVVTAVSCLGTFLPAVTDLEDLQRVLEEGFETTAITAAQTPEEGRMPESTTASVDTGTIRQRFNFEWTLENDFEQDTYWWWCRSVRVDPNEIIADDDDGGLWLVPYETDGKDEITFGEPQRVREEFVPVSATATSVVANFRERKDQKVLAANLERPDKPAPKTAASSQPDPQEDNVSESTIDMAKLRERLGLPDDATEEQINEALAADTPAAEPTEPATTTGEVPEPTAETTPAAVAEPVAASAASERGVTVDKDALAQLQAQAKAGDEARQAQLSAEREQLLTDAVKAGKFPPAAKASYRKQLDKGGDVEASTRTFIEELPDNTVPVTETGEAGREDGVAAASAGLPDSWFPNRNRAGNGVEED
jgi:hypothetical protein